MSRSICKVLLFTFAGSCVAICGARPAAASDIATVKCPVNEDRVWVYDSIVSFDVEAKLRCGETVEIVSRVKGYVKVRTDSGVTGYLPDSVFPDLPPLPDDQDKLGNHNAVPVQTAQVTDGAPVSVAAAAAAYSAKVAPAVVPATNVATAANAPAVIPAAHRAPVNVVPVATKPRIKTNRPPEPPVARQSVPPPPDVSTAALVQIEAPLAAPAIAVATPDAASLREVAAQPMADVPESDEYPDAQPDNASADPSCRVFFSAYGLGAEQYKWLAEARRKEFSNICPAPNLQSVDFVILFTHDSDSYVSAMPAPVHTDLNGFSDFSPMTTVDSALMSPTDADKAHYELAWVFHVKRGAFDPARFSPRRRPQYEAAQKGSRASTKAVEEAFNFIQQQAPNR